MNLSRLLILIIFLSLSGCSTKTLLNRADIKSPIGIYHSDSNPKFILTIKNNLIYTLCSNQNCFSGSYEDVTANYGVILLDFFASKHGLEVERLSHSPNNTSAFFVAMKKLRLSEPRPNDLAFHISDCDGIPCAGIGHRRSGIKFYKTDVQPKEPKFQKNVL